MRFIKISVKIFLLCLVFVGCNTTKKEWGTKNEKVFNKYVFYESGLASFYGHKWAGRSTANGEKFDPGLLTAASKTLPFNSTVMVKNMKTGRFVIVRINDRGPYVPKRVIDLSSAAAKKLGITRAGIAKVNIYLVSN
jgi:rare lipoprotein A